MPVHQWVIKVQSPQKFLIQTPWNLSTVLEKAARLKIESISAHYTACPWAVEWTHDPENETLLITKQQLRGCSLWRGWTSIKTICSKQPASKDNAVLQLNVKHSLKTNQQKKLSKQPWDVRHTETQELLVNRPERIFQNNRNALK